MRKWYVLTHDIDEVRKLRMHEGLSAKDPQDLLATVKSGILAIYLYADIRSTLRDERCGNFQARLKLIGRHVIARSLVAKKPCAVTT